MIAGEELEGAVSPSPLDSHVSSVRTDKECGEETAQRLSGITTAQVLAFIPDDPAELSEKLFWISAECSHNRDGFDNVQSSLSTFHFDQEVVWSIKTRRKLTLAQTSVCSPLLDEKSKCVVLVSLN